MSGTRRYSLLLLVAAPLSLVLAKSPQAAVRSLEVVGNRRFTSGEILGWMTTAPGQPLSGIVLQRDLSAIVGQYRNEGFLEASAVAEKVEFSGDSTAVDLRIAVAEGRRSVIGTIALTGQQHIGEEEILEQFDSRPGEPLRETTLEKDVDALLGRYEKLGYPFARCRLAAVERRPGPECDSLDLRLSIAEGRRMTVDEIRVQGNRETRPDVVVRETRIRPGELYNPAKIDAIRGRLNRLNIFSSVSDPELYLRGDRGGVLITVKEGSTNTFDGIVGYVPSTVAGEGGYLTGLASVFMRNLFGTGRKLSFRWQKEDRWSQELGVSYTEPWVFSLPLNIGGGFLQRQQDSSYVRRSFDARSELMLSEELSVSLLFNSVSVIPSADTTSVRVPRSSTATFGGELLYDTRDDLVSPTSGARYQTDYQYGRKRIDGTPLVAGAVAAGDVAVQRFGVDLEFYLSTVARQVFAVGVHGRETESGEIDESDMYRLGGTNSLRGYRESQFLGSRIAWMNTEYRFLLARRSFLFGFLDTGYYFRPSDDARGIPRTDAFKYGYGFGIRLDTSLGNLGVSFALGEGDSIGTAKIHFGLINEF